MERFGMPASLGFREAKILPHSQNPENMAIVPHAKHNFGGYIPLVPYSDIYRKQSLKYLVFAK